MEYEQNLLVDDEIYAYLLADRRTLEVLDGNKLSQKSFLEQDRTNLRDIFVDKESLEEEIKKVTFLESVALSDITLHLSTGDQWVCDVEICITTPDESLLFLTIKEKEVENHSRLKGLMDLENNPILTMNLGETALITYGNQYFYQCIRMTPEELTKERKGDFLSFLAPDKQESFIKNINQRLEQDLECDIDVELTFDGQYYNLFRLNAHKSALDGLIYGVLIVVKRQSELMKKIEYDQQYFDIMQLFSKDLLFRIDIKKRTLVHRGDISKFEGLLPEVLDFPESIRHTRWVHPEDLEGYIAFSYRLMHGMDATFEPRFQFFNGDYDRYRLQGKVLFDKDGNPVQVVGKSENIQKYVEIEAKANYDSLTTTLNKGSFQELITNILQRAVSQDRFAMLFIDFDDFKSVNDKMGHVFGDFLLEVTGKRILNCVRNHDKVGRVGGDEFVVFFQHAPNHEAVLERAESILRSLRRKFNNGDQSYSVKASIGISLYPEHGTSYEVLYDKADKALYRSKELGKDVASVYQEN